MPGPNPTVFTFWRPLTVNTTLKFNILDAVYNYLPLITDLEFCFNVQLFGCLFSQANYSISKIKYKIYNNVMVSIITLNVT